MRILVMLLALWLPLNVSAFDGDFFSGECNPVDAASAVVQVIVLDENGLGASYGTAVAISETEAVTAYHVITEDDDYETYVRNSVIGETRRAEILRVDEDLDLAVISGYFEHYLDFHQKIPRNYSKVWAIGFPAAITKTITEGHIQALSAEEYITSASVMPGNSGGPLLICEDGTMEILGIVTQYYGFMSYAVTAGTTQFFIEEL